jgi:hypothetical protein
MIIEMNNENLSHLILIEWKYQDKVAFILIEPCLIHQKKIEKGMIVL